MSRRKDRGKKYASLATMKHLHPSGGFAVVEEGTLFEPARTFWWHRVEMRARERVRSLRSKARSAYFVRLDASASLSTVDKNCARSEEN